MEVTPRLKLTDVLRARQAFHAVASLPEFERIFDPRRHHRARPRGEDDEIDISLYEPLLSFHGSMSIDYDQLDFVARSSGIFCRARAVNGLGGICGQSGAREEPGAVRQGMGGFDLAGSGGEPFTLIPQEHIERVLGHAIEGVAGTYNRYSYLAEKRAALDLWGAQWI